MSDIQQPNVLPPSINLEQLVRERSSETITTLYDKTVLPFTTPAKGATVVVSVADSSRFKEGMWLYFNGVGIFKVESIASNTSLLLTNSSADADLLVGVNAVFNTCAYNDPNIPGRFYTTLTSAFTAPTKGTDIQINVIDSSIFINNMFLEIINKGIVRVATIVNKTSITVTNYTIPKDTVVAGDTPLNVCNYEDVNYIRIDKQAGQARKRVPHIVTGTIVNSTIFGIIPLLSHPLCNQNYDTPFAEPPVVTFSVRNLIRDPASSYTADLEKLTFYTKYSSEEQRKESIQIWATNDDINDANDRSFKPLEDYYIDFIAVGVRDID